MTEEDKLRTLLACFYEHRNDNGYSLRMDTQIKNILATEYRRLFRYLNEAQLVNGKINDFSGGGFFIHGSITSKGVDVIEQNLSINTQDTSVVQTFTFNNSNNIAAGNQNTVHQNILHSLEALGQQIDKADAAPTQKAEAKDLLAKLIAHPLVASIAGGAIGLLR